VQPSNREDVVCLNRKVTQSIILPLLERPKERGHIPVLERSVAVELARGAKVFVSFEVGVTNGEVPNLDAPVKSHQGNQDGP
jgi:hypothetical protein